MAKPRTRYVCQQCGAVSVKWQGRCTECGAWSSLAEEIAPSGRSGASLSPNSGGQKAVRLSNVALESHSRFRSGVGEFDRVAGGGIVPGSLILVGGPPGIGKSTLLLQIAEGVGRAGHEVLYVSGEESLAQVRMRAERLGVETDRLRLLAEIELEAVRASVSEHAPRLVLIDSIQTMFTSTIESAPGSVSQVRECTAALMRVAKGSAVTFVIVGHVTKEGSLAGPRVMEHLVDTVLYFEGDRLQSYRILKAVKNRFGSTSEVGLFEMQGQGLVDVPNASEFFLSQRVSDAPGSCVVPVVEGTRALLVEVQALCNKAAFGTPARRATGIESNRLVMLLAVMEKHGRLRLSESDVFVNVAGGMEVDEPAADLGVVAAIASTSTDRPIRQGFAVIGEIGLGGEIRAVPHAQQRVTECARMGVRDLVLPASNLKARLHDTGEMRLHGVQTVREALRACLTPPKPREQDGARAHRTGIQDSQPQSDEDGSMIDT
ncbi:MAG: DNA repair protein RadA [Proteobacteria bacterium]|nr:DNA repair protein RadA [Pseudomonadota bacterium]